MKLGSGNIIQNYSVSTILGQKIKKLVNLVKIKVSLALLHKNYFYLKGPRQAQVRKNLLNLVLNFYFQPPKQYQANILN